ncbi:MAG: rod shape-determining protein MreD [Parcubacteria group bacterium]
MPLKIIRHAVLILAIFIFELAIRPNLPGFLSEMNFTLAVLVFVGVAYKFYLSVAYGVIIGFAIDAVSGRPFGIITVGLALTLLIVYLAFNRLFTNKSFYSLFALNVLATFFFNVWTFAWSGGATFLQTKDATLIHSLSADFGVGLLWRLLANTVLVSVLYAFFYFRSRRFSAAFIDTSR